MSKQHKFTKLFDPKIWLFDFAKITGALPVVLDLRIKYLFTNGKPYNFSKGKFIVCCNHRSFRDPVIVCNAFWKRRITFLATKEIFKNKFVGWMLKRLGAIKLDRDDTSIEVFKRAKSMLDRGHLVTVFPESHVSDTNEIREFKSGVALMATICDAHILPIYIPKREKWWKRQIVVVGDKLDYKQIIGNHYPSIQDVNIITQKLKDNEVKLKQYYDNWILRKKH